MGKTALLSLFLIITLIGATVVIIRRVRRTQKSISTLIKEGKDSLATVIFLALTILLYLPASLFLANSKDMLISFWRFLPIILIPTILVWLWLSIMLLATSGKLRTVLTALVFGGTLSVYVQSNFLNFHMPILSGGEFDFGAHSEDAVISCLLWGIIIVGSLIGSLKLKKWSIVSRVIAYGLSAMQLVSLVVMIILNSANARPILATTTAGEFELGSKENVILFVLDSIEGHTVEEYLKSNPEYETELSDFTLFTESMGGGAPTQLGMPVILTGCEYDGFEEPDEYFDNIWKDTTLYDGLKADGYDVRFYATPGCVRNIPVGYVENIVPADDIYYIPEPMKYMEKIYMLSALYGAPQMLKPMFMLNTSDFEWLLGLEGDNHIYFSEPRSFKNYWNETSTVNIGFEKTFRYYHLDGVHLPLQWNENLEFDENATWEQAFKGQMELLLTYIDSMRSNKIYDNSMIIICGDHGQEREGSVRINPAVFIKLPNEQHDTLLYNDAPITMRNLYSTIASVSTNLENEWGATLYDIDESSCQERLHTASDQMTGMFDKEGIGYCDKYIRVVPENTYSDKSTTKVWNPYAINVISVDAACDNSIDVIPENGFNSGLVSTADGYMLENEFTTCINMINYNGNDISLGLEIDKIMGNSQPIRIWVNDHRLDDVDAVDNCNIIVPASYVKDDRLYIRLVMPKAMTTQMIDSSSTDSRVISINLKNININIDTK